MKTKLLAFLFSTASLSAFGNGMGTYALSSAVRSSDPILREIKDVTLLSEKLLINLNSGYSEVTVKYVLWNHSDNDYIDIDYAFPVDFISGEEDEESWRWDKPDLKRIAFFCNDEPLAFTHSEDKKIDNPESLYKESLESFVSRSSLYRRWYYTTFSLKKHSVAYLEVTYSLANLFLCDGDSPLTISYMDMCKGRNLTYDFSPAACWGDGIIRDFYVEVNGRDLLFAGDTFVEHHQYSENGSYNGEEQWLVEGLDFERQGDRFVYRTRNFDLKKAQPLRKYPR